MQTQEKTLSLCLPLSPLCIFGANHFCLSIPKKLHIFLPAGVETWQSTAQTQMLTTKRYVNGDVQICNSYLKKSTTVYGMSNYLINP